MQFHYQFNTPLFCSSPRAINVDGALHQVSWRSRVYCFCFPSLFLQYRTVTDLTTVQFSITGILLQSATRMFTDTRLYQKDKLLTLSYVHPKDVIENTEFRLFVSD